MAVSYTLYQDHLNEWVTRQHGLPSHQIHDLLFCNRNLWLATPNGLAIFDGENMQVLDQRQGLLTNGFRRLAIDGDYILASSDRGVDRINSHDFSLVDQYSSVENGLGWCQSAVPIDHNKYLLACAKGLRIWDVEQNQTIKTNSKLDDEFIVNLVGFEHHTALIQANTSGLWLYSNDTVEPFPTATLKPYGDIETIIKDQNFVWLVAERHLLQLDSDFNLIATVKLPKSLENIRALKLDKNSDLYIASDERFVVLSKKGQHWDISQTIHEDILVNAFCSDQFNNLWAASDFSGLLKVSALHKFIKRYSTQRNNSVLSIQPKYSKKKSYKPTTNTTDTNNGLLIGGTNHSFFMPLAKLDESEEIIGLRNNVCWDLQLFDNIGHWAATNKGLVHIESYTQSAPKYYTDQKLGAGRCLAEFGGNIIYGSVSGLFHFNVSKGEFNAISNVNNRSLGYIYAIKQIDAHHFYLCTLGNGIWTYNASTETLQRSFDSINKDNIYAIDVDASGRSVLAAGNQIWLVDNNQYQMVYEVAESVAAWSCVWYSIDKVLLGTPSGLKVLCLSEKKLDFILEAFPKDKFWEFSTTRSLFGSPENGYWCGLNKGLQHIDIASLEKIVPPPIPELKHIKCNTKLDRNSGRITLIEGNWTLQIQVGCFWLWDEDSLTYQYRIDGLQKTWRQLDGNNLTLTTLPTGKYIIEIKVLNSLSQSSSVHQLLMIEVSAVNWISRELRLASRKIKNITEQIYSYRRFSKLQQDYMEMEKLIEHRTDELKTSNEKLLALNKSLEALSNRDQLTELYNRRYFFEQFDKEIKRSMRDKTPISILMIDVDYFKKYNDHYGHQAGDTCLKSIAKALDGCFLRSSDMIARYGGEEFIALMHNSSNKTAMEMANQIISEISQLKIEHELSDCSQYVTISVGVTTNMPIYNSGKESAAKYREKVIGEADKALYKAKSAGRNLAYNYHE